MVYQRFCKPSPLGWCWGQRQTFGLTRYDKVFMPSKIYLFFNHRCCEQLHKVKLLIVPRKCRIEGMNWHRESSFRDVKSLW